MVSGWRKMLSILSNKKHESIRRMGSVKQRLSIEPEPRGFCILWIALFVTVGLLCGCSQQAEQKILRIGMSQEPRTLNIWLSGDRNTAKVLSQIYQPLYIRAPKSLDFVPWLAAELPEYDARNQTYTVRLRPARWSDGTPLTSEDVAFTGRLVKEFEIPRFVSKWRLVQSIETPDAATVVFHLNKPYATFLGGTMMVPIVPAHQWRPIAAQARKSKNPLIALINHPVTQPIGSGPFVFKQWRSGNFLYLVKNEHFFGTGKTIGGFTLGPYFDGILFKNYANADVGILALRKGSIDMYWWGIPAGYLKSLSEAPDIRVYASKKSALYFMGFNLRRPPFDHLPLRQAIATLVDKEFIVHRILQDQGTKMDSIVPPGNLRWYNPDIARYGTGLDRKARIKTAYEILSRAGYTWSQPPIDKQGQVQPAGELRRPDGTPMKPFDILTPPADYDAHRAMSGMMVQEWLRDIGLPAFARPMHFGSLLEKIKSHHDFDMFVLGYGRLPLHCDYLRYFFQSSQDKRGGYNMSGYRNQAYDRIATESQSEMNESRRRELLHHMQKTISMELPYIPLYNPFLVEAVRIDRFEGWVSMIEGIGNRWSFCQLKPRQSSSSTLTKGAPQ
jgi:ABC-type transport system substrate-binding protein